MPTAAPGIHDDVFNSQKGGENQPELENYSNSNRFSSNTRLTSPNKAAEIKDDPDVAANLCREEVESSP